MVRPTGPGGVSFFNGPPNGPGRGSGGVSSTGLPNVPGVNGPPNPFGLPRTPNPKGTFARLWATQCYSSRVYMYVRPVRIAFLHGFARFAHASSFDWFAPTRWFPEHPKPKKGLSRLREFPQPAQCLKTFFSSVFARSGNSNFSVIKVFLRRTSRRAPRRQARSHGGGLGPTNSSALSGRRRGRRGGGRHRRADPGPHGRLTLKLDGSPQQRLQRGPGHAHRAGVSVDGYTLTLAANPWNIVRTYT